MGSVCEVSVGQYPVRQELVWDNVCDKKELVQDIHGLAWRCVRDRQELV